MVKANREHSETRLTQVGQQTEESRQVIGENGQDKYNILESD